jgi:signal peptide peptidase SppA
MQRIFDRPLLIAPHRMALILAVLSDRLAIQSIQDDSSKFIRGESMDKLVAQAGGRMQAFEQRGWGTSELIRKRRGVAVIEIDGVLVKKNGMDPYCGMTGYDGIEAKVRAALADEDVKAIWFDINSGGGEVSGCFGLCDFIYENSERNGGKLMVAMCADDAYSAAYALASSCDMVAVPPSGGAGSIGVLVVHAEYSKQLEEEGVTVEIIRSGKQKARFNSIEPLANDVRARIQKEIDEVRDQFVDLVARNRGLSTQTVYETEGLEYMGERARAIGLVDKVISEQEMFAELTTVIG